MLQGRLLDFYGHGSANNIVELPQGQQDLEAVKSMG